jgi:hypothetical protein
MRQFILTCGTLSAVLFSCWEIYQGIAKILTNRLEESFFHLLIVLPISLSLAVAFDYINSLMHEDYRKFRRSLVRKKGAQQDIENPNSREVRDTPWEDDSSHTH